MIWSLSCSNSHPILEKITYTSAHLGPDLAKVWPCCVTDVISKVPRGVMGLWILTGCPSGQETETDYSGVALRFLWAAMANWQTSWIFHVAGVFPLPDFSKALAGVAVVEVVVVCLLWSLHMYGGPCFRTAAGTNTHVLRFTLFYSCFAVTECQFESVGCLKRNKKTEACVCDWPFLHDVSMKFTHCLSCRTVSYLISEGGCDSH